MPCRSKPCLGGEQVQLPRTVGLVGSTRPLAGGGAGLTVGSRGPDSVGQQCTGRELHEKFRYKVTRVGGALCTIQSATTVYATKSRGSTVLIMSIQSGSLAL
jgi:hypothetical protein